MALSQDKHDACSPLFMIVMGRNRASAQPGARPSLLSFHLSFRPTSSLGTGLPLTHRDQIAFHSKGKMLSPLTIQHQHHRTDIPRLKGN